MNLVAPQLLANALRGNRFQSVSTDLPADPAREARFASEEQIAERKALAEALRRQMAGSEVKSLTQGLNVLAQGAMSGLMNRKAENEENARRQALAQALQGAMGGGAGGQAPDPQAMATIMALDPNLGAQIMQRQQAAAAEAAQAAEEQRRWQAGHDLQRERFDYERNQPREVGGRLIGPDGSVVYQPPPEAPKPPEPFTLSPGQSRFGPDGQPIAAVPAEAPSAPEEIREYEYAVQNGYEGSFLDYQTAKRKAGASNVNVNSGSEVGTIPQGYELFTDPETGARRMQRIPGGPAEAEEHAAAVAAESAASRQNQLADIVVQDIDRALGTLDSSGSLAAGPIGNFVAGIPVLGQTYKDVTALTESIRANIGFEQLQQMREASPTGGALGQVTEREMAFLQSVLGSLSQEQSPLQLRDNLARVKNAYLDIVHGAGNGPPREALRFNQPSDGGPEAPAEAVPPGIDPETWRYMTPEERQLWQN